MKRIDIDQIGELEFDIQELHENLFCRPNPVVWSWGAEQFARYHDKVYRFKVNGHHHKGHVYITLDWDDTFHLYFTEVNGEIVKEITMVYVDELIRIIDEVVEKIDDYEF